MKSIDTLDVFLKGEITDLCIPTEDYALNSDWYSMFNDAKITQYLDHGLYPNTPLKQLEFLRNANKSNKNSPYYIGQEPIHRSYLAYCN